MPEPWCADLAGASLTGQDAAQSLASQGLQRKLVGPSARTLAERSPEQVGGRQKRTLFALILAPSNRSASSESFAVCEDRLPAQRRRPASSKPVVLHSRLIFDLLHHSAALAVGPGRDPAGSVRLIPNCKPPLPH